ncbi:MAG TPA: ribosome rescue protein RqcH [Methanomassiliicoccales archaeon]|nr:ribosome rescue protein RqcH [Methanomassiliicoccales archaeon]
MKKEMTAFDVATMTSELQGICGGFLDKIFHWEGRNVLIRINVQSEGKKELFLKDGKWLHLEAERPETPDTPSGFAVHLRKVLSNTRILSVSQREFDRIVTMDLASKEGHYQVIFELIGEGNLILVHEGKIINALEQKKWRHRDVIIGAEYAYPPSRFDPRNASLEDYEKAVLASKSDLVRTLATSVNLGGQYGEEICLRTSLDKGRKASSLTHAEIVTIYEATLAMFRELRESPRPCLVKDGEDTVDATPIPLLVNSGWTAQDLPTLSQALVMFLAQRKAVVEKKDSELERLQRQLDQQIKGIEATESEAAVLQAQGDLLYTSYTEVNLTLGRMKALAQKNNWEHLKEEGAKIPLVTSVDPRKKSFHMKVGEEDVALDYDVGIDENANRLYTQAKELREKTSGARTAMDETRRAIGKRVVKGEKEALLNKEKVAPTKRFWYESYKWFLTSGGRLVVGGRDAKSNDQVVKKHLGEKERYAHADMHGAPSIVLKNGADASDEEMKEVCQFAICHSKAWNAGAAEGTAYWVLPDQVSKRPEAGEFAPRGAFIIRGKRNYIYHLPLEMLVAELEVEGARKVMCAPRESVGDRSVKYVIIIPGKTPRGKISSALARAFQVPEEEISRILPPGDVAIKEAHGVIIE